MLKGYVDHILESGKIAFSAADACEYLGISKPALVMAASRLKKKGELVVPYRDFYLPLPPEYRKAGCLPAEQLLPPLMQHIGCDYYVALLSAAVYHGASHQRPQLTQVISPKRIRNIHVGAIKIKFIYKASIADSPAITKVVRTGYLNVAAPETTAMDLLLYPKHAGGLNHIATILYELIESIEPDTLLALAKQSDQIAWIQRLGYILQNIETDYLDKQHKISNQLYQLVNNLDPSVIPLIPGKVKGYSRDKRWRIIVNATVESDL